MKIIITGGAGARRLYQVGLSLPVYDVIRFLSHVVILLPNSVKTLKGEITQFILLARFFPSHFMILSGRDQSERETNREIILLLHSPVQSNPESLKQPTVGLPELG